MKSSAILLIFFVLLIIKLDDLFYIPWLVVFTPLIIESLFSLCTEAFRYIDNRNEDDSSDNNDKK